MSEKIPVYNQSHKALHQTTAEADLRPVVIKPSLLLYRLEVFIYLFMLASASIAIFPFVFVNYYLPLMWLVFSLLIFIALRASRCTKNSPAVSFNVSQKMWYLKTSQGLILVKPCDDILVWPVLIMLPIEEIVSGRKRRLIALPDSMSPEDWRRLRVWLRMALRKNY